MKYSTGMACLFFLKLAGGLRAPRLIFELLNSLTAVPGRHIVDTRRRDNLRLDESAQSFRHWGLCRKCAQAGGRRNH